MWLPVYCFLCRYLLGSWRVTLLVVLGILTLSPTVIQTIVIGNDHLANVTYVCAFALLVLLAARREKPLWMLLGAAAVLGFALSSRANFVFVLLPLGAALLPLAGPRRTLLALAMACAAFGAVTLPFYLYDPDNFTPFDTTDKIIPVFPYAQQAMVLSAGLLALVLAGQAVKARDDSPYRLLRDFAIVQAYVIAVVLLLFAIDIQHLPSVFRYAKEGYGVFFLLPALLVLLRPAPSPGRVAPAGSG